MGGQLAAIELPRRSGQQRIGHVPKLDTLRLGWRNLSGQEGVFDSEPFVHGLLRIAAEVMGLPPDLRVPPSRGVPAGGEVFGNDGLGAALGVDLRVAISTSLSSWGGRPLVSLPPGITVSISLAGVNRPETEVLWKSQVLIK